MGDISKREWIIGIAVAFIVTAIAIITYQPIQTKMIGDIKQYEQSLKIDNNSDQFIYAIETNVGDVLSYGKFLSLQPQSIPELIGEYSIIEKVTEEYTMHIDLVCTTDGDGNQSCHTETSYSWDYDGSEYFKTNQYEFLGYIFLDSEIQGLNLFRRNMNENNIALEYVDRLKGNYIYKENKRGTSVGDIRYRYDVLPTEFSGSLFARFFNDKISNPMAEKKRLYIEYEKTIDEVLENKRKNLGIFNVVYYVLFILIGIGIYLVIAYHKLDL